MPPGSPLQVTNIHMAPDGELVKEYDRGRFERTDMTRNRAVGIVRMITDVFGRNRNLCDRMPIRLCLVGYIQGVHAERREVAATA